MKMSKSNDLSIKRSSTIYPRKGIVFFNENPSPNQYSDPTKSRRRRCERSKQKDEEKASKQ